MSNNNGTDLTAWTREVCALHTELARPIETMSDPRMRDLTAAMRGITDWGEFDPEHLGELYFQKVGVDLLPACPLPVPEWGVERDLRCGEWPDVAIIDRGKSWTSGEVSAVVERETTILVDVLPADWNNDPDGNPLPGPEDTRLPGDTHELTSIYVTAGTSEGSMFYVALEEAYGLECALGDALHTLRPRS